MFSKEEHNWLKKIQEFPEKYNVVIDNDAVWIQDEDEEVFTFNNYGYEFIYELLNDMGINAELC